MYKPACNRILVYSPTVDAIDANINLINPILTAMYKDKKIKTYKYTYKTGENVFKEFLEEDDSCYIKVLYSINKTKQI